MEYSGIEGNGDGGVQPAEVIKRLRVLPNLASTATNETVEITGGDNDTVLVSDCTQSGKTSAQHKIDL